MAGPKKGQMAQFECVLVDSTDFASVESGVTESDFNSGATRKWYGYNHGVSDAFTSGTLSKAGRLIRSGVFLLTVNATENAYDRMHLRVSKTGVAEQIITWQNADYDDSDIYLQLVAASNMLSSISAIASDAHSAAAIAASHASDAYSAIVNDVYSFLIGQVASDLSDILSAVSDAHSDLASKIGGITASVSASDISDIASAVYAILSSDLSDIHSAAILGASHASDAYSAALLIQSRLSDLDSRLVSDVSDIISAIGAITVTISASDVSDIASAVVAGLPIASVVSDIYSLLQDNYSLLSDFNSNFGSRIPKEPAARSQLSDIGSDLLSYLTGMSGMLSDTHSAAILGASHASDAYSAALLVQSRLSDLDSRLVSDVSDLASAVAVANSRVLLNQSRVSDIYSLLSDVSSDLTVLASNVSDIESAIDAGVSIGASDMSDLRSAITAAGFAGAGADPTDVPGVTATRGAKLDWLTALARNKIVQSASDIALFNDGGSQIASATVSDDGTDYTRQEWAG